MTQREDNGMNGDLSAFLKKNKRARGSVEYAVSKDFTDESGAPVKWVLKAISTAENERIREECTREVAEKGGGYRAKVDTGAYMARLAAACVVQPNLYDAALQDSYGVKTPEALLKEMVDSPGEYAELMRFVSRLNGFDEDIGEEITQAKN